MRRTIAIAAATGLSALLAAQGGSAFVPGSPTTLPGDRIPSPGLPPLPKPGETPRPYYEPASTTVAPSLERAMRVATAALEACRHDGFRVGVAVVDMSGQPRLMLAADQALGGHGYTAVRKALAALAFGAPTSTIPAAVAADPAKQALVTPAMMPWPGAVPLYAGGKIVGAVGVSGAASTQDERCAVAGAHAGGA